MPACRVRARRGVGFSRSPSGRIRATLPTVSSYRGLPRIGKTRGTVPNCQRLDDWIALASRTGRRTPYWWFYYQEELNRLTNTPGKDNPCLFVATWFCWTNAAFFFFFNRPSTDSPRMDPAEAPLFLPRGLGLFSRLGQCRIAGGLFRIVSSS